MAHVLEPREVEPGALWRWSKLSFLLILRSPAAWLLSAVMLVGLGMHTPHWLVMAGLGLWAHVHFQTLANRADRGALRWQRFPSDLGAGLLESGYYLTNAWGSTAVNVFALFLAVWLSGGTPPGLSEADHPFASSVVSMTFGMGMLSAGTGFMTHGYLLSRLSDGGGFLERYALHVSNREKNGFLGMRFDLLMVGLFLFTYFFPWLVFVVAPYVGAMSYVSFRDIYLHRGENSKAAVQDAAADLKLAPVRH